MDGINSFSNVSVEGVIGVNKLISEAAPLCTSGSIQSYTVDSLLAVKSGGRAEGADPCSRQQSPLDLVYCGDAKCLYAEE